MQEPTNNQNDRGMWSFTDPLWETIFLVSTIAAAVFGGLAVISALTSAWVGWKVTEAIQREADIKIVNAQNETKRLDLLLNDEIRKNAWRRLDAKQIEGIAAAVRKKRPPFKVLIAFNGNDPEETVYASDLHTAFTSGGANVDMQPSGGLTIGQMPVFGLLMQGAPDFDAKEIETAFAVFDVPFQRSDRLGVFALGPQGMPWGQPNGPKFIVCLGHKPPSR